jgi:hypothetical protein
LIKIFHFRETDGCFARWNKQSNSVLLRNSFYKRNSYFTNAIINEVKFDNYFPWGWSLSSVDIIETKIKSSTEQLNSLLKNTTINFFAAWTRICFVEEFS